MVHKGTCMGKHVPSADLVIRSLSWEDSHRYTRKDSDFLLLKPCIRAVSCGLGKAFDADGRRMDRSGKGSQPVVGALELTVDGVDVPWEGTAFTAPMPLGASGTMYQTDA